MTRRKAEAKRKDILLLGAIDMEQVIEAAQAIQREHQTSEPNLQLIRALETAVVVCYWRPFSQSNTVGHLRDADAANPELHAHMKTLRNKAHAHTDTSSGRKADIDELVSPSGIEGLAFTESWWALPAEWLPSIISFAVAQRDAWRAEGIAIRNRLTAE